MNIENILIPPYAIKGRWYKFFLESDGIDTKLTTSDIEDVTLDGPYLVFPEGFIVMNIIIDFHTVSASALQSRVVDIQYRADGTQAVYLPNSRNFDYGDIYILGHYN